MRSLIPIAALLALFSACDQTTLATEDVSTAATIALSPELSPGEPDLREALVRERLAPHRDAFAGDLPATSLRVSRVELTGRGDLERGLDRVAGVELIARDADGAEVLLAWLDGAGMTPEDLELFDLWDDPELDLYVRVRGEELTAGDELRVEVVFSVTAER
jgi:hypothetical protein